MTLIAEWLVSFFLLVGAGFALIGSLGLAKLYDLYSRLHGPTKATTLGVGCTLIASSIYFSAAGNGVSLHEILVTIFLFLTAPVGAHLMAKAALHLKLPARTETGYPPKHVPDDRAEVAWDRDAG